MAGAEVDTLDFVDTLRRAGLPVGPDRVHSLVRALDALPPSPASLYWAGRLTLCASVGDVARYHAALTGVLGVVSPPAPVTVQARVRGEGRSTFRAAAGAGSPEPEETLGVAASPVDVLRQRDLAELSTAERIEAARLLALLARMEPMRHGRRHRREPAGAVDPARTVRALLRSGGEPVRLERRARRPRPRRLVLIVDVSGSMGPYADALLRFAHAAVQHRPHATDVYTVGTRLTRVTSALRHRDVDLALRAAIPDWRGGTRLADTLTLFLRRYGHRGTARQAVVVVFSDGWERGDPAPLGEAVAHLRRLAYRLIWVSPHAARPGFAPTAGGLAAVAPHLDALVGGHTVAALEGLVREVVRA